MLKNMTSVGRKPGFSTASRTPRTVRVVPAPVIGPARATPGCQLRPSGNSRRRHPASWSRKQSGSTVATIRAGSCRSEGLALLGWLSQTRRRRRRPRPTAAVRDTRLDGPRHLALAPARHPPCKKAGRDQDHGGKSESGGGEWRRRRGGPVHRLESAATSIMLGYRSLRRLGQAAVDDSLDGLPVNRWQVSRQPGVRLIDNGVDGLHRAWSLEGMSPGHQLVEDDAEGEDIAAGINPFAPRLLRRHVGQRPEDSARRGLIHREGRNPNLPPHSTRRGAWRSRSR